jgi:hypothetical protein
VAVISLCAIKFDSIGYTIKNEEFSEAEENEGSASA